MFADRREAGEALGSALERTLGEVDVVLGIARGGVVVAEGVARVLLAPLDVVIARKLGAPGQPELAVGAVAPGVQVLDAQLLAALRVRSDSLRAQIEREQAEIARRTRIYRGDKQPADLSGKRVVIVDDGLATGATAVAAARWARDQSAELVIVAVPVAARSAVERLEEEADDVIALEVPAGFRAVGEFYSSFDQTSDDEVIAALAGSA